MEIRNKIHLYFCRWTEATLTKAQEKTVGRKADHAC